MKCDAVTHMKYFKVINKAGALLDTYLFSLYSLIEPRMKGMRKLNNPTQNVDQAEQKVGYSFETKYCKHCAAVIPKDAVICTACGRQVEELKAEQQIPIVINNTNTNVNTSVSSASVGGARREKNKWAALLLCLFLGVIGGHKFYEGKVGMGILYLFTCGLFFIGIALDLIILLFKPNPYYI